MSKRLQSGEAQVSVTHRARQIGTVQETVVKREDVLMAESKEGEIQKDEGGLTEPQKNLPDQSATVAVGKKLTLNLGNYESATVSVLLSMPCAPDKDAINDMYQKASQWVDGRIDAERASVRKAQGGIK